MRWLATFVALVLMTVLLRRLTTGGPLEARATLALGFLLLAAHLGGELAKRARLPRITGYLLTGFALGPAWLGVVGGAEVRALNFLANAAVALIAFAAGTELQLERLRGERVALARMVLGALVGPLLAVTAVVLLLASWLPLTRHQPFGDAVVIALVLGVVAAASSPAVTMGVMEEVNARGPFARAVLGVTVAKDVAVIVLFSLVLAVSRPLSSAGALNIGVAWTTLSRVGGSLGLGVALGYLVAHYLRVVWRDTPLFLVAVAFLTAEIARILALETMLIALAAGFVLENFSRVEGERLRHALRRGSLPVYVVFFALAGADLHVGALATLWPWVLLFVGLRAVGLRAGTGWAGRSAAVTPDLARYGWLSLISQAGITLGLATLARRAFPEWGVSLEALVVTMIGVHELIGPICFRRALVRAGEVTGGEHVAKEDSAPGLAVAARRGAGL